VPARVSPAKRKRRRPAAKRALTPKLCGSRTRNGKYCRLAAGHQTDHPGVGPCYRHGGNLGSTLKSVGAELAYQGIMNPDTSPADMIEIEPHNGLLIAVRSAAGEFFHWQNKLAILAAGADEMDEDEYREEYNALLRDLRASRDSMARLSKMALDAGLAERQVQLQERMADLMVRFARELLSQIPLTKDQERMLPKAMEGALLALESGEEFSRTPRPKVALRNYKIKDVIDVEAHEAKQNKAA